MFSFILLVWNTFIPWSLMSVQVSLQSLKGRAAEWIVSLTLISL